MVGAILPANVSDAFTLLKIISDPGTAKAHLDQIAQAQSAADDRLKDVTAREQALSDREAGVSTRESAAEDVLAASSEQQKAVTQDAGVLAKAKETHAEARRLWELERDNQAKALGARETAVAQAEAALAKASQDAVAKAKADASVLNKAMQDAAAREQAAAALKDQYEALLVGAKQLLKV